MMEYKGYVAKVEFDDSAEILHGKVVNSGPFPIATFEATDARQLREEFERSVDEYLTWCEEDGVEPRKPYSGKLNLRLGSDLHAAVASAATADGISINSWIVQILQETTGERVDRQTISEFRDGAGKTTKIGYVNRNNQRCGGHRGLDGAPGQRAYRMNCLNRDCGWEYGANGCDVFQRKCPECQGGEDGIPF